MEAESPSGSDASPSGNGHTDLATPEQSYLNGSHVSNGGNDVQMDQHEQRQRSTGQLSSLSGSKPLVDAQGRTLNPRSCVTCRKRKVRCDKLHPCTNCTRAHIDCIFPAPGRAPRRPKKPGEGRDKELLERLRRLEGVVKGMGVDVSHELDKPLSKEQGSQPQPQPAPAPTAAGTNVTQVQNGGKGGVLATEESAVQPEAQASWIDGQTKGGFENRFGRLVVNEGKSRYVNNSFWASLSNEVEDLKGILNQSSDEGEDMASPSGSNLHTAGSEHGFIFSFSSLNADMHSLHPPPEQIPIYWELYKERVDPLVKILHIPTLEATIQNTKTHLSNLSRGLECLLFSIYYAAATSVSAADCLRKLGEERSTLLTRYRFALEQALARANFLTTEEIIVLQAFVIFLICLRRNCDGRVIWTLTGLVVRIAQTIGIHRDGSHFNLSPFEAEMRRRVWWQVCILDTRASEDHGCDPTIVEQSFDTKMPLNIEDEDITPEMTAYPPERQGCTAMSFSLLRFDVTSTFRRINYVPPGTAFRPCTNEALCGTLEEKERWITECHKRIEERYLKHCDMSVPLYWVTATVARLMMSKMWLMVYHPFQRMDGGTTLPEEIKEKLFITSLENLEYSLLLETEARTMKWGWLFKTYMQWHALAFTLSELCHRTTGDMVDRAWVAVEKTRDGRWGVNITDESNTGHLWRPLKKIYRKANEARRRGMQEQYLAQQRAANPPTRTYSPNENPMFGNPHRPRMTRAPLSQAQLTRLTSGPYFGKDPFDKHELLRTSRNNSLSTGDTNGNAPASADVMHLQPDAQLEYNQMMQAQRNMQGPQPTQVLQPNGYQNKYIPNDTTVDFNDFQLQPDHVLQPMSQPGVRLPESIARSNSTDTIDNDMTVMDTSGDLNWENWDQLVRQFGMDVDSGAYQMNGAGGFIANNWDPNAMSANLRMGYGMNGSDMF